jgi:hypothetical protein
MSNFRRPRTSQPFARGVDRGNSLTRGLIRLYDFSRGGIDATGANGMPWSCGSGGKRPTRMGEGLYVNAASSITSNESVATLLSGGMTALFFGDKYANPAAVDFVFGEHQTGSGAYNWGFYSGNNSFISFYVHNGTAGVQAGGAAWVANDRPKVFVGTYGDGDNFVRIYEDGKYVAAAAQTGTIQQSAHAVRCNYWSGTTPDHAILLCAIWDRRLTADEVARIGTNPWQLFAPAKTPFWAVNFTTNQDVLMGQAVL